MVFLFFLVSSASFGTGNPGLAVPDFYLAGLSRAGRLGVGLRFFCHGAQTFPVGLRGAAAFCGTNCVKLRSASAPQSRYYF